MDADTHTRREPKTRWPRAELPRSRWQEFRRSTVRDTALALLSYVALVDGDGRTVGLPYTHVCEVVRALRPGARTTVRQLRWYVGRCLDGQFEADLPRARPRSPMHHPLSDGKIRRK
jgi:hypothetical protein